MSVFPKPIVCVIYGFTEFVVPQAELHQLQETRASP
jgi:hypothetical protein